MRLRFALAALVAGLSVTATSLWAEPPGQSLRESLWPFPPLRDLWHKPRCWCPDDYCPKRLPHVACNDGWLPDDYCPKPLPCAAPPAPLGCADDYCAKSCGIRMRICCGPEYTCGPAGTGGKSGCACSR
jgi:hypothetical protein